MNGELDDRVDGVFILFRIRLPLEDERQIIFCSLEHKDYVQIYRATTETWMIPAQY